MPPKDLPSGAKKIFVAAEANARNTTCKDEGDRKDECASRIAWSAVKKKYKKVGDEWVQKTELISFSMAITKTSYDKRTNTRRWSAIASDIDEDKRSDNMTLGLYEDFLHRIEIKELPPKSFQGDFWNGGMPYLSVSHYSDLDGKGVPGPIDTVYIDGKELKATGRFDDTPIGRACFQSISKDLDTRSAVSDDEKIRISIGFLDWGHKHKSSDYSFDRATSKDVICSECLQEIIAGEYDGKEFLLGQLVHLALTREPVNTRTKMEVRSMTTQKEDAESIVGDEIAEELDVEEAKIVDKSEVSDNDPEIVVKSEEDKPLVEASKHVDHEDDEEEEEEDDKDKKKKKKEEKDNVKKAEVVVALDASDVLEAIKGLKADLAIESVPVHPLDVAVAELKSVYDEALELPNPQEALQMIQEPFESLMLVIQSGVAKTEPEEEVEITEDGEIAKALSVITQELGLLRAEVSTMKSQPQNVLPKQPEVPIRRSLSPELFMQPVTETTKSSTPKLREIVERSVTRVQ